MICTTGIFHHCSHSPYTRTWVTYMYLYMAHSPSIVPFASPVSTYLAPSSCDRNRPPRSQVARKLLPFVPRCSLVPSPPNSQPSLGFPEPNVHLIRAHHKSPSQCPEQWGLSHDRLCMAGWPFSWPCRSPYRTSTHTIYRILYALPHSHMFSHLPQVPTP